ncbi:MAG: hypothetical protein WC716_05115 [Chitinophagaceae bacterium]|jgi:hypothetical protein
MKSLLIAFSIIATVIITTLQYYKKPPADQGNISKFSIGLSGIDSYITPHSTLNIFCKEPIVQQVLEARYVLFPVELEFNSTQNQDTTLLILSAKDTSFDFTGQKIWHNEDTNFSFTLIKNFSMP